MKKGFIKIAALGIGSFITICPVIITGTNAFAATNGKTASQAISWVKSKVGTGIDYDGFYGNQCVDLAKAYYAYLGAMPSTGNGADYAWNSVPNGWDRYKGVQPQKGDILVYTGGYGGYGHVAIYESNNSTYHQNFSSHSYIERVAYNYNKISPLNYWGVIRPDFIKNTSGTSSVKANNSSSFSGVKKYNGIWTYFTNGKANYSYTGVAKSTKGNWIFVKNGKYNTSFTGVAKSTKGNWVFVKNGRLYLNYTGVAKSTKGNWIYVKKGYYDKSFTGISKVYGSSKKFYITKGRWNKTFSGRYKNYTVRNGVIV